MITCVVTALRCVTDEADLEKAKVNAYRGDPYTIWISTRWVVICADQSRAQAGSYKQLQIY